MLRLGSIVSVGVATFCKPDFTPTKCEEGLSGTLPSSTFDDSVGHRDGVDDEFSAEELRALDNEGRCVITCHQVEVRKLFKNPLYEAALSH